MRELSPIQNFLYRFGALLMLVGTATFLFARVYACIAFVAGVLLFAGMQVQERYEGDNTSVLRLRKLQMLGGFFLAVSAVLMVMLVWDLYQGSFLFSFTHHNEWVVALAIGALLQLYTAFRIPAELDEERRKA